MTVFRPTPEQAAIIDHPPTPLRVVAGAGTGKTTTIVERLAAAVRAGADPARCLGITFTNKAAAELRSRLHVAIGDTTDGREIEVATYHGFAASLLDEFGAFVGYEGTGNLMDDGHRTQLAARVLGDLQTTDLDLAAFGRRRDELLELADGLTSNLLTPEALRSRAPDTIDDVWRTRLALNDAAERYIEAKRELGMMEYADLIALAVELVGHVEEVRAAVSARYEIVLLDEYQDTDAAQRLLLTSLFADGRPVTAVGDADQTIYEWRGASLENFSGFPSHFPLADGTPAPTLPLSVNRRSDRRICALANVIRDRLSPVVGSLPLTPRSDAEEGVVVSAWFGDDAAEAAWIAEEIRRRYEDGAAWSDVAVLCRKRSAIPAIVAALRSAEIPYAVGSLGDLLDVPEVADVVAWLRILADPADEAALLRVLRSGKYRFGLRDLAALRSWGKANGAEHLMHAVVHPGNVPGLTREGDGRRALFGALHGDLYAEAQARSASDTVGKLFDRLGLWDEVAAMPESESVTARVNLGRFVSLVARWRPLDGHPGLPAFIAYLDALDEASAADELNAAGSTTEDAVQVITAHTAKGLEWPIVFIPALARNVFPSGSHGYDDPQRRPTALPFDVRLDRDAYAHIAQAEGKERSALLKARHDAGEWRLAYVAVTRAKHELIMTGHMWDRDVTTPRTPSDLLLAVDDVEGSDRGPWAGEGTPPPSGSPILARVTTPDPLFAEGWAGALRGRLADREYLSKTHPDLAEAVGDRAAQLEMRLDDLVVPSPETIDEVLTTSVTNLVVMDACPRKFRWIHHDRLPRRPQRSARLGTEFHRSVELHNLGIASLDDAVFDRPIEGVGGEGTGRGKQAKNPWDTFLSSRFAKERATVAEAPFVLDVGGAVVRGKIDAIYVRPEGTEIVDYKSGRATDDPSRATQLEAYALAVTRGAVPDVPQAPLTVTFAYFGSDRCEEVTTPVDAAWLDQAKTHIATLVETAADGPWDPTPSDACRYCDFLRLCPEGRSRVSVPDD